MPQARGFIGAGDIYVNRIDPITALFVGWAYAGDASKFAIKGNSKIKERESKSRDGYGQVVETVAIASPADLSITFAEVNKENLTLAFMGSLSAINQGAGNLVDEVLTFKTGGYGVQATKQNLAEAALTVKSSDGVTTYVKDTDYTVNYRLGIVFPVAGGALAAAITADADGSLPIKLTAAYNAMTGSKIAGSKNAQLRCAIKFDGKNHADGLPAIVNVWEAVLTPSGEFDFLKDDWNDVQLSGRMKTPVGKSEPFEVELRDA
jgi:hypothetical protein